MIFIIVITRDPKVQIKTKDILDKYNRLPYNYQSKIGYGALIQNVILNEILKLLGTTIVSIDIKLKLKVSTTKYLESKQSIMFRLSIIDSSRSRKIFSTQNML